MRVLYLTFFLLISDQVSKLLVKGIAIPILNFYREGMKYGESVNVIGDFFKITFVENPGMAFGINVGDESKLFLSLFSLVASIGILFYLYKVRNDKLILRLALAMILAGAIGNLIDRTFYGLIYGYAPLFYGKVVDFFNVDFWDFTLFGNTYERWPIFNIADASVTIGVMILILFHRDTKESPSTAQAEEDITTSTADDTALNHVETVDVNEETVQIQDTLNKDEEADNGKEIQV